jgi:triosephosphate isomerase
MHAFIRKTLVAKFGSSAEQCSILYGGSVNAGNAAELFAQADVDGGLVGGASLKTNDFLTIAAAL